MILNEAKTFIQRGDGISPNHYRLHAIRGQLASVENRSDDAITEYQAAIANLPAEGIQEGVLYPVELHINLAEQYRSAENQNAATEQVNLAAAQLQKIEVRQRTAEYLRLRAAVIGPGRLSWRQKRACRELFALNRLI